MMTNTTRIPDTDKPRIVVIGGGFGGLELIKALKKVDAQIVLFDKQNHHTFQPLLYQVATSGLETASIVYPFRKAFGKLRNFYFRLGKVIQINPEDKYLETSIGGLHYDYLVIATGADSNYYGLEDIAQHSLPIKTIEDAILLRNRIIKQFELALLTDDDEKKNSLIDYVIVGGGPTGVEIAGALAELKKHVLPKDYKELDFYEMDIHLIEAAPRLLTAMAEESSERAYEDLKKMGVDVRLNTSVKSYDGYTVTFNSGEQLITRTLIWAAGVAGVPIKGLEKANIVRGNRLQVDEFNKVIGYDNIFAVGDVAAMITDETPKGHPMMAPPAMQQGRNLAKNLIRMIKGDIDLNPFKYFDKGSMATIGRNKAVVNMKGLKMKGFIAWLAWMFIHLIFLVGFKKRVQVLITWITSYFSYDKSNRLIIGKPTIEEKQPEKISISS
ncbi:MAG: NAD(P)/FAD-dependent oxidoreductase [Bacteroidota bacterium]